MSGASLIGVRGVRAGIEYAHESFVDAILRPGTVDRKVRTPEELQAALAEPGALRRRERCGCM